MLSLTTLYSFYIYYTVSDVGCVLYVCAVLARLHELMDTEAELAKHQAALKEAEAGLKSMAKASADHKK